MQAYLQEYSWFDDILIKRTQPETLDKCTNLVRVIDFLDKTASTSVLGASINPDSQCASIFLRLERQAGLPLLERFKFLLNKRQNLEAKNA